MTHDQKQWSRVIYLSDVKIDRIKTFVVATDLLLTSGLPSIINESGRSHGPGNGRKTLQARVRIDGRTEPRFS